MNVVDSSAWLEYLSDSPRAAYFVEPIESIRRLIVPVVVVYELFKKVLRERGEHAALEVYALLSQGQSNRYRFCIGRLRGSVQSTSRRQFDLCDRSSIRCDALDTGRAFFPIARSPIFPKIRIRCIVALLDASQRRNIRAWLLSL